MSKDMQWIIVSVTLIVSAYGRVSKSTGRSYNRTHYGNQYYWSLDYDFEIGKPFHYSWLRIFGRLVKENR